MIALQSVLVVALAPLLQGIIASLRARLCGRPGPSVWQPYRDLRKLVAKEAIVALNTSAVVLVAPGVALGASLVLTLLVPLLVHRGDVAVDVLAFSLTLALGRFVLVLAALDMRSGFGGMAASREMFFAGLTEAPLILALAAAAFVGGTIAHVFAAAAVVLVMLSETARIPVDNQETHYELTMVHEGLTLEYSGWHLALLHLASQVRQAAFFVLTAAIMPGPAFAHLGWLLLFTMLVPLIERGYAKLRLFEVPQLFASAALLAIASVGLHVLGNGAW